MSIYSIELGSESEIKTLREGGVWRAGFKEWVLEGRNRNWIEVEVEVEIEVELGNRDGNENGNGYIKCKIK